MGKWLYLCDEHTTEWDSSRIHFTPDPGTQCSVGGLEERCPAPAKRAFIQETA